MHAPTSKCLGDSTVGSSAESLAPLVAQQQKEQLQQQKQQQKEQEEEEEKEEKEEEEMLADRATVKGATVDTASDTRMKVAAGTDSGEDPQQQQQQQQQQHGVSIVDGNRDGLISREEFVAAAEWTNHAAVHEGGVKGGWGGLSSEKAGALFDRLDRNSVGRLDGGEAGAVS